MPVFVNIRYGICLYLIESLAYSSKPAETGPSCIWISLLKFSKGSGGAPALYVCVCVIENTTHFNLLLVIKSHFLNGNYLIVYEIYKKVTIIFIN